VYNRFPRKNTKPLRAVSVARTVEAPQESFEIFLGQAAQELDRRASIRNVTSTRITFLESNGINKALRTSNANPDSARRFSYRMSSYLDKYRATDISVSVDQDNPLILIGRHADKLALNLVQDDQLLCERGRAEAFLTQEFGGLPKLKPFRPHITIGSVGLQTLNAKEIAHPELLLPQEILPETIALNGLTVFLDQKALKH
jgi:hypothetical protein